MRVLAYEARRLGGLRSTWLILAAVLICDAAVAAVLARQVPAGVLSSSAAVRCVTAVVPLLPLPIAALGAGALGALSYGHEVRHPGLSASQVSLARRVGLVAGKAVVVGLVSAALALLGLLVNLLVVGVALAPSVDAAVLFDPAVLRSGLVDGGLLDGGQVGPLGRAAAAFVLLVAAGGSAGVLAASLFRSASAGLLLLCALPALVEPAVSLLLRRSGQDWPSWVREVMPFQYGLDWVPGGPAASQVPGQAVPVLLPVLLAAPLVLLALAALVAQLRRRSL
ncbi:hypothetical protein [Kitasatospora camelliae]|uniref:ABC-2 type transport system permease protein n=1 Tax=Kitasatospora camelliae TaxID=3156397 RepID=A0AAU8K0R9_9ACTN